MTGKEKKLLRRLQEHNEAGQRLYSDLAQHFESNGSSAAEAKLQRLLEEMQAERFQEDDEE